MNIVRILILVVFFAVPIFFLGKVIMQNSTVTPHFISPQKAIEMRPVWQLRSIDTVKYSRDVAREKANDPEFDELIDLQVKNIAQTGASHVAIGTPYDKEFIPFMKKWIAAARKHRVNVWFRGNMSGWEEWFGYKEMSREEHTRAVEAFILENPDLFADGDIFTSCTECENGGPGDPRMVGGTEEYRKFLINEYKTVKNAFKKINKDVGANYYSMNGDVAKLIMDRETTKELDGIIVIDHYVKTKERLNNDITSLGEKSGGKVILGEWGAPIPDIHGKMSETEQATWVGDAFELLSKNPHLLGVNYWTNQGSSTELWKESDGSAKKVVDIVKVYYSKKVPISNP